MIKPAAHQPASHGTRWQLRTLEPEVKELAGVPDIRVAGTRWMGTCTASVTWTESDFACCVQRSETQRQTGTHRSAGHVCLLVTETLPEPLQDLLFGLEIVPRGFTRTRSLDNSLTRTCPKPFPAYTGSANIRPASSMLVITICAAHLLPSLKHALALDQCVVKRRGSKRLRDRLFVTLWSGLDHQISSS